MVKGEKMDDASLKANLVDALAAHYKHANAKEANEDAKNDDFAKSRDAYQKFISHIQTQYVQTATNRAFFSLLTLPIVCCYAIVIALITIEYMFNSGSI